MVLNNIFDENLGCGSKTDEVTSLPQAPGQDTETNEDVGVEVNL